MVSAYILIETSPGMAGKVAQKIRAYSWVGQANAVTGPYDIICVVGAENVGEIGSRVVDRIQNIEGVVRTLTCLIVDQ